MFSKSWAVYPRKVGKLDAEKAFNQMARRYNPEAILAGAEAYARQWAADGIELRFTPHPATWLRAGRWMDLEHETVTAQPLFRTARSVDELRTYLRSVGKAITVEIEKAREVSELPAFARMVPINWNQH